MFELDHPNIIKLHEVHETRGSIYLIMELLQGGELLQNITVAEEYTLNDVRCILRNILEGLAYLQSKNIAHRDIKPPNIIRKHAKDDLHHIKIVDFGFATHCEDREIIYRSCGTPGFVAPEVCNHPEAVEVTPAVDIFSAGIVFFYMYA
jgi:serine/threonine protein kinase